VSLWRTDGRERQVVCVRVYVRKLVCVGQYFRVCVTLRSNEEPRSGYYHHTTHTTQGLRYTHNNQDDSHMLIDTEPNDVTRLIDTDELWMIDTADQMI
jgi:hypothetical protein